MLLWASGHDFLLKVKKVSVFKKKRTPIDKFPIKILRFLIFQQQKVLINLKKKKTMI